MLSPSGIGPIAYRRSHTLYCFCGAHLHHIDSMPPSLTSRALGPGARRRSCDALTTATACIREMCATCGRCRHRCRHVPGVVRGVPGQASGQERSGVVGDIAPSPLALLVHAIAFVYLSYVHVHVRFDFGASGPEHIPGGWTSRWRRHLGWRGLVVPRDLHPMPSISGFCVLVSTAAMQNELQIGMPSPPENGTDVGLRPTR